MKHSNYIKLLGFLLCTFVSLNIVAQERGYYREYTYERNYSFDDLKITTKGKVEFNYEYTDVVMMGEEAYFKIAEVKKGLTRKLHLGTKEGEIIYKYFENNKEKSFEPKGKEWMTKILPDVVRNTGIDLKNRVKRIYNDNGLNGFLAEYDKVKEEHYKLRMVSLLIEEQKLSNAELVQILKHCPAQLKDKHMLASFLQTDAKKFLATEELSKLYFQNLNNISETSEKSRVLYFIFENNNFSESNYNRFLNSVKLMPNDKNKSYEKTSLYTLMLQDDKIDNKKLANILADVKELKLDMEAERLIQSVLEVENISSQNMTAVYAITKSLSKYQKSNVLQNIIHKGVLNDSNYAGFKSALSTVKDDHGLSNLLQQLMNYEKVKSHKINDAIQLSDNFKNSHSKIGFYNQLFREHDLSDAQQLKVIAKMKESGNSQEKQMFVQDAIMNANLKNEKIENELKEMIMSFKSEHMTGSLLRQLKESKEYGNY
jgi:hypothetical protein